MKSFLKFKILNVTLFGPFVSGVGGFDGVIHLDLSYNSFENTGLTLLCSILERSLVLKKLELRRCQLRESSLKVVLKAIQGNSCGIVNERTCVLEQNITINDRWQ